MALQVSWHRVDHIIPSASSSDVINWDAIEDAFARLPVVTPLRGSAQSEQDPTDAARRYVIDLVEAHHGVALSFESLFPDRAFGIPDTETIVICFTQLYQGVELLGPQAAVELDAGGAIVAAEIDLEGPLTDLPLATLNARDSWVALVMAADLEDEHLACPAIVDLKYVFDPERAQWRPAYFFRDVPFVPTNRRVEGHRSGRTYNVIVDAVDATVLQWHSSMATSAAPAAAITVPVECRGVDDAGVARVFHATKSEAGTYHLRDPLWRVLTCDLGYRDIADEPSLSFVPVTHHSTEWPPAHSAAIVAHVQVVRVLRFFSQFALKSYVGNDDSDVVVAVNCTDKADSVPPRWANAMWWKGRIWIGQVEDGVGGWRSFAHHTDVTAHELVHGLIERTSRLQYSGEAGALNESLCDIFGIVLKNWPANETDKPKPLCEWVWTFGDGLAAGGGPLRNLAAPLTCGQPDHLSAAVKSPNDNGGVHSNSGIHNLAAYRFAQAVSGSMSPREYALLFYLVLLQLPPRACFITAANALIRTIKTLWEGDVERRTVCVAAVRSAYMSVGVGLAEFIDTTTVSRRRERSGNMSERSS
jgi:bacillolysin